MSATSKIPITKESSVGETAREKDVKNRREALLRKQATVIID
jgi:hypothetical protein